MVKTAKHSLKEKFDEVIERKLGTVLLPGMEISLHQFDGVIRNTDYVRSELQRCGFKLLLGSAVRYTYRTQVKADNSPKPFNKDDVMKRLKRDGVISGERLGFADKKRLVASVSRLKNQFGVQIESERVMNKISGQSYMVYKLKTSNSGELSEAC